MTTSPPTVTREAGTSQPNRRPVRRHFSVHHLLIVVVVALAFLLNFLALQDRDATTMVAVADRPLVAGAELTLADLRFVPIDTDFAGLEHLMVDDVASTYVGWIIGRPVAEGEPLGRSILIEPAAPSGLRSMSIPVSVEHAVGGTLSPGDRIDVISVDDGIAFYVVVDVEVLDVSEADRGSLGGLSGHHIVVGADAEQALALAAAIDAGSIEVIRSTGAMAHGRKSGNGGS